MHATGKPVAAGSSLLAPWLSNRDNMYIQGYLGIAGMTAPVIGTACLNYMSAVSMQMLSEPFILMNRWTSIEHFTVHADCCISVLCTAAQPLT